VSIDFLKALVFEACDNYTETRYYRRVNIHRDVVSYALVMANNMHITEVAKCYKKDDDEFIHKFYNQFGETPSLGLREKRFSGEIRSTKLKNTIYAECRDNVTVYPKNEPKLDGIIRCLLKMSIRCKARELFEDIFELLYECELEDKERKLLM